MYKNTATLADVYHLALPPQTQLLVGSEYLSLPVSWACSLRPSPPAFPKLDGNELALIDMEDLRRLDPKLRLERVVRSLQQAGVSGVAVLGEVSDSASAAARDSRIALFRLPDNVSLTQVERAIIRLIVDRASYIAQRSADLQRELNQAALNGGGLQQMAQRLAIFAQQPIVLIGDEAQLLAAAGLEGLPAEPSPGGARCAAEHDDAAQLDGDRARRQAGCGRGPAAAGGQGSAALWRSRRGPDRRQRGRARPLSSAAPAQPSSRKR